MDRNLSAFTTKQSFKLDKKNSRRRSLAAMDYKLILLSALKRKSRLWGHRSPRIRVFLCRKQRSHQPNAINAFMKLNINLQGKTREQVTCEPLPVRKLCRRPYEVKYWFSSLSHCYPSDSWCVCVSVRQQRERLKEIVSLKSPPDVHVMPNVRRWTISLLSRHTGRHVGRPCNHFPPSAPLIFRG